MQYYTLTNQCYIFTPTGHTLLNDIDDIEREGLDRSIPSWTPHELAQEFPEAKATIKRLIKEKKSELSSFTEKESDIKNWCYKNCSPQEREHEEWYYTLLFVDIFKVRIEHQIKKLEQTLFYMQKGKGGELDVQKARERPISDFIEFNGFGFARSIWNTADKTPSMKLYRKENRVHCFSTGEDEDVIGVVMALKGCSFIEAVKFILN